MVAMTGWRKYWNILDPSFSFNWEIWQTCSKSYRSETFHHDLTADTDFSRSFYHWKYPRKTISTLIFVATCLIFTLFADMGFCMKIFWFVCGGAFFLCWPISSMYPKYRYLVSPIKWILWGIPTDGKLSLCWSIYTHRKLTVFV